MAVLFAYVKASEGPFMHDYYGERQNRIKRSEMKFT
jgi:hypothetical protein